MRVLMLSFAMLCIGVASGCTGASLFSKTTGAKRIRANDTGPLVQIATTADRDVSSSLFAGRSKGTLFAPVTHVAPRSYGARFVQKRGVHALRDLIAQVEAGAMQYNAVVFSAKIKPPKPPTRMTVNEVFRWIDETPGQNHAIGRYQFIPKTLRGLVRKAGVPGTARFSPKLQDRLADILLEEAGFTAFRAQQISQETFMNNLARIWAGLPNSSGVSHYAGVAGNKAGMTWARFTSEMNRIFPPAPS